VFKDQIGETQCAAPPLPAANLSRDWTVVFREMQRAVVEFYSRVIISEIFRFRLVIKL
jgi:hypothetical protein